MSFAKWMVLRQAGFLAIGTTFACGLLEPPKVTGVPDYVMKYAPLCYLHHQEQYFPSDLAAHVQHVSPEDDKFQKIGGAPSPLSLTNLDKLNAYGDGGKNVYLTSNDDVTQIPEWIKGTAPDCDGKASSIASVAVIMVDKGNDMMDAFFLYFYSFDYGGILLDAFNVGNHVGDWEQNMIRFEKGVPKSVWFSQHGDGQAFVHGILNKHGDRFLNFIANGTHANYATSGKHDRTQELGLGGKGLGGNILNDFTDGPEKNGKLWDPLQNAYFYNYSASTGTFTSAEPGRFPTEWLNFKGRWGDKQYPKGDRRQVEILGGAARKYVDGPTGPYDKALVRKNMCPDSSKTCTLRNVLSG